MFKQENPLPGAELHLTINNRHGFTGSRQDHANMRWHVVAAFGVVGEVIRIFWHEAIEKFFQIMSRCRIRIFHNDHAATGVLNKNGDRSVFCTVLVDL